MKMTPAFGYGDARSKTMSRVTTNVKSSVWFGVEQRVAARVWARTGLRLWHRVQLPVQVRMWKEVGR